MNLQQLQARVRRLSGVRLTELLPDDDLTGLLNEARREVEGLRQWPFLDSAYEVASEGDTVEVPDSFRHVTAVILPGGSRLRQVTVAELDRARPETGTPTVYARTDQSTLRLWPEPAGSVDVLVRVQRRTGDMVAASDAPEWDDEFHPLLAYMVAARVLAEEGDDSGRAAMYADEAGALLARMQDRYLSTQDAGTFVLGSGGRRRRRRP